MAFLEHPTLHPLNLGRTIKARVPRKAMRDRWNRILYGPDAPLSNELIYVRPRDLVYGYSQGGSRKQLRRQESGSVGHPGTTC